MGVAVAWMACAQLQLPPPAPPQPPAPAPPAEAKPPETPPEKPPLVNSGRPMLVEYHCTADDIMWAGMACTEDEPCRLYLELSAVEAVGNKIFLAGNIHTRTTTLYSVLLASEDHGKTWREPFQRQRACSLEHIQFVDFESGWVSGQSIQPLPQDPFLLITSDGGKTWRHRPIFNETRAGTVQQFWFSSKNAGSLIVDRSESGEEGRYELYESPNGGETWMIKEVTDKPLKLKRAGTSNADWRIRADRRTEAFQIEKRQGEHWTSVAAFSIGLGLCKPPEPTDAPPPPVETKPAAEPTPVSAPKKPPTLKRP